MDQFFRSRALPDVSSHEWIAQANAISPFDFRLTDKDGDERHVDAKSTSGRFANPVYMSIAEIRHAVHGGAPYDIFRLYNVKETSASLKIARNVGLQLASVLNTLKDIPEGVSVDSLSFEPSFFDFDSKDFSIEVAGEGDDETVE